jgi:hypothetical protein
MARERSIVFENFSGGYAGELPSWRLNKNMWHGLNLFPAVDGSLVPRSGLVRLALTGRVAGQIAGMGWADGGATTYDRAWYVQGTALRAFDPYTIGGAVAPVTGALSGLPTRVVAAWDEAGVVWMTNYADGIYKYDLAANTLTRLPNTAGGPAGRCITSWGAFLVTGGGPTNPARIYWSDGDGLDDWVATPNYEPIGSLNSAVTGLYVLRGQLVVAKDDGSWWMVTGDLPTSEVPTSVFTVRNVFAAQTPLLEPQHGAVIGGQAVWQVDRSAPWPTWFNGSTLSDQNHLKLDLVPTENGGIQPNLIVSRLTGPTDLLIAAGSVGTDRLMLKDSIWSRHRFSQPGLEWTAAMGDGLVLVADGGDTDNAPRFFVWQAAGLESPPDDSAPLQSVTDDGVPYEVWVELPETINDQGLEVLVRSVTVDFRRVDQGLGAPPQVFAFAVASTRRTRDETGAVWSQVQRWSGPARTVDKDRTTFMCGDQGDGAGFIVRLFDIRGVAIQRVRVQVVEESERVV